MNQRANTTAASLCVAAASLLVMSGCQVLDSTSNNRKPGMGKATVSPENVGKAPAVADSNAATSETAPTTAAGNNAIANAERLKSEGKYQQALVEFERAIEINPRLTNAYLGAGDIYREQGDYTTAETRYAAAAQLEPANFRAQYSHGLSLQLLNRLSDAIKAYLRALQIRPDDFNANLNVATAYLQLGEPQQARRFAQRAVQLNGNDAAARTNLGAIYSALGEHENAVLEYQQAAELTTLSAPLLLNLANSLGRTGRFEEMINTLNQLVATEPSAAAFERLGMGQFRLRRYDEALNSYRGALQLDPDYFPALNGVGVCLLNQWEWSGQRDAQARDEALRSLRRSLQIERDQPRILELLGRYQ